MTKNYITSRSLNRFSIGDIRQAEFNCRKSVYLKSTQDQPAVLIEQSKQLTIYIDSSINTVN